MSNYFVQIVSRILPAQRCRKFFGRYREKVEGHGHQCLKIFSIAMWNFDQKKEESDAKELHYQWNSMKIMHNFLEKSWLPFLFSSKISLKFTCENYFFIIVSYVNDLTQHRLLFDPQKWLFFKLILFQEIWYYSPPNSFQKRSLRPLFYRKKI